MNSSIVVLVAMTMVVTGVDAGPLSDAASWLKRQTGLGNPTPPEATPPETPSPPQPPAGTAPPRADGSSAPAPDGSRSCRELPVPASVDGRNKACLAAAGALAAQRGDTLTLRMDDGSRKTFTDTETSGDFGYGYALLDFYPQTHLFVAGDVGRDTTSYIVVDGRTGAETRTGATEPFYAPDGRFVFEIVDGWKYRLREAAGLKAVVWDAEKDGKGLGDIQVLGWRDDGRLMLRATDSKRVDLVRSGEGRWSLDESPPAAPVAALAKPRQGFAKEPARCGIASDYGVADATVAADACRARLGERLHEKDDTLVLGLADGTTKTFFDSTAPRLTTHEVVAYSRAAHVFVVEEARHDGTEDKRFFSVDSRNGATTGFRRFPYVSPDGDVALEVAASGEIRLVDLAGGKVAWRFVGDASEKVSPHTVFLGWDDARTARVLIDDARVLTIARGDAGWSAAGAALAKAHEPGDAACAMPKSKPDAGAEEEAAAERRCLATIPVFASRADGVLTLKLEDGMTTREIDRPTDSGTRAIYRLLAYHPAQHQFVVGAIFYEESNWFIIDSISGERTTLDGEPVFSPSRTSLVVPIASYGEGIVDVVVRGAGPHPEKAWGYLPPKGGKLVDDATVVAWRGDDRVDLRINKKPVSVSRDPGGAWVLTRGAKAAVKAKSVAKPQAADAAKLRP